MLNMSELDFKEEDAGIWGVPLQMGISDICTHMDKDEKYLAIVASFEKRVQNSQTSDQETQESYNYRLPQVYGDSEDSDTSINKEDVFEFEDELTAEDSNESTIDQNILPSMNNLNLTKKEPQSLYDKLSVQNASVITNLEKNKSLGMILEIVAPRISKYNKNIIKKYNRKKRKERLKKLKVVENNAKRVKNANKISSDTKINLPLPYEEWEKLAYEEYVKKCEKGFNLHKIRLKQVLNQGQPLQNMSANNLNTDQVFYVKKYTKADQFLKNIEINEAYSEYEMQCINTEKFYWNRYNVLRNQVPDLRIIPAKNNVQDINKTIFAQIQENNPMKNVSKKDINHATPFTDVSNRLSSPGNSTNKASLRITQTIFLGITEELKIAPSGQLKRQFKKNGQRRKQWQEQAYEEYMKNCENDINKHRIRLAQTLNQEQPLQIISANNLNECQVTSANKRLTNKQIKKAYNEYEINCIKTRAMHLKQYNMVRKQKAHQRILPSNKLNDIQIVNKTATADLKAKMPQKNQQDQTTAHSVLVTIKTNIQAQSNEEKAKSPKKVDNDTKVNKPMTYKKWEKLAYEQYVRNCEKDCNLHEIRLDEILKQKQSGNKLNGGQAVSVNKVTNQQVKQAYREYDMNCEKTEELHWKQYNIIRSQRAHLRILPMNKLKDIQDSFKHATAKLEDNKLQDSSSNKIINCVINSTDVSKQLSAHGTSTNKNNVGNTQSIGLGIIEERKTTPFDIVEQKIIVQVENNKNKIETTHEINEENLLRLIDVIRNKLARKKREIEKRKESKEMLTEQFLACEKQLMNQKVYKIEHLEDIPMKKCMNYVKNSTDDKKCEHIDIYGNDQYVQDYYFEQSIKRMMNSNIPENSLVAKLMTLLMKYDANIFNCIN